jgi:hypothetical protein
VDYNGYIVDYSGLTMVNNDENPWLSCWWERPTPLKNDGVRQWGWDDIPYMKWKIIQMCQTTNQ